MSPEVGMWAAIGPTKMGSASTGALFSIAVDPADPRVIYVSSPFSGVWKTEDTGTIWRALGDDGAIPAEIPVAAVATDPSTPGRVYVLTREFSLIRSDDAGLSWTYVSPGPEPVLKGLGAAVPAVTDLIVDPSRPEVLHFRATNLCARSGDGGQSWQVTKFGNATCLVIDSTQPDVLYVGIPGLGVYRTLDGGASGDSGWTDLTANAVDNWTMLHGYDVKIALTRADPNTIYARFQRPLHADVYRSLDGGASWESRSSMGVYSALICGDDADPATVYLAGVDFYRSEDGGQIWAIKPGAHVDHHNMASDPTDPAVIYTACDGGIYRSPDRADSWQFIGEGLANGLFYDLALAATKPEIAIAGTQDNGTVLYNGTSTVWAEILGGDGATVAIDPTDANIMYAMNQGPSSIAQSTNGGASFQGIADGLPTDAICFNLHFQVHPTSTNILLASCGSLWWTQQPGQAWSELFTPPNSPNDNVVRSAVDPSTDTYYAGTGAGRLYAAVHGRDWHLVFSHPKGAPFVDLIVDPDDTTMSYAAFADARIFRLRRIAPPPEPLQATDISNGLPQVTVRTLAVDAMHPFTIYAGTVEGVFRGRSQNAQALPVWSSYNNGLPHCDVRALRVHPSTGVMRAATFGRSAYEVNTDDPIGSLVEIVGHVTFLRAHELGSGYGKPPNFLDCEVIALLAEAPSRAFGFKLRADEEEPTRREQLDLLRSAFITERPVRLDYIKTGPRVGEIVRVASP